MRHHIFISISTLILIFISSSCSKEVEVVAEPPPRPVKYGIVAQDGKAQTHTFAGIAKASIEAKLSFRTGGQIESLSVKTGDKVRKGQLIATLDNRDTQLSYEQSKASLENARVQKTTAQSNMTRVRQLYQANTVSLAEYEQAKNQFASAKSSFESANKALDLQARQLGYNKLFASASGIVTAVNNEVNEVVQAGAPIIEINAGNDIELLVGMPETYISQVKKNDKVSAKFSSIPGTTFPAKITEISFARDPSQNTYPVTALLLGGHETVRPGMSGDVTFNFGNEKSSGQLVVPVKAVGEGTQGNFVFLIEEKGDVSASVKKQQIKIGKLLPGGFAVMEGLKDGDKVATAGLNSLLDGMKVRLMK